MVLVLSELCGNWILCARCGCVWFNDNENYIPRMHFATIFMKKRRERINGRWLCFDQARRDYTSSHSPESHNQTDRRIHCLVFVAIWLGPVTMPDTHTHTSINCFRNLPEHKHTTKLLRIFFAKLLCHCLQFHRFISGRRFCSKFTCVHCSQPALTHTWGKRHMFALGTCVLSIVANATCTNIFSHPLKWRRRQCHNNGNIKEQDVCASNRRHCFRNIVDFNWLWSWFCRCGKVHSTCSAPPPLAAIIIGQAEYLTTNSNVNNIIKTHIRHRNTRPTCELWLCLPLHELRGCTVHRVDKTQDK